MCRRRSHFAAVLLAAALAVALPSGAKSQAPLPACPGYGPLVALPPQIAVGRPQAVSVRSQDDANYFESLSVTVGSADGARPYGHPATYETALSESKVTLLFSASDGPALVTVREIDNEVSGRCTRTFSGAASPVPGVSPRIGVRTTGEDAGDEVRFSVVPIDCETTTYGPVVITIRQGGRKRTFTTPDTCVLFPERHGDGYRMYYPRSADGRLIDQLHLQAEWASGSYHRLRYSVAFLGRPVASGTLGISMGDASPFIIYKGTDDYQNYCKNKHKTIYQSNGRRYCFRLDGSGDEAFISLKRDKRPKSV
jgi:hypothetical protein